MGSVETYDFLRSLTVATTERHATSALGPRFELLAPRKSPYALFPFRRPQVGVEPTQEIDATAVGAGGCDFYPGCRAANALQEGSFDCHALASLDTDLQRVVGAWEGLPTHIRKTILALVGFVEPPVNGKTRV